MRIHQALLCLMLGIAPSLHAQGEIMTQHAAGTIDVKVIPQPPDDSAGGPFSRLFLDKQFHGQLDGASKGTMLGTMSGAEGSGGYVALEQFSGTLDGKRGSFVLQHNGSMVKNIPTMIVAVVPGSGTGELTGIAGTMRITIGGGIHSYQLDYTLGGSAQ
jgi:hypothetical protein